jgi:hypothetical protein
MKYVMPSLFVLFIAINITSARTPTLPPNPVEIFVFGDVTALTHVDQMGAVIGKAEFSAQRQGDIASDTYLNDGMRLHGTNGGLGMPLQNILPGIASTGRVFLPDYRQPLSNFPSPFLGGGSQAGFVGSGNLAATFAQPVTQFGATLSLWPVFFYLTAWKAGGSLIGEVAIRVTSGWPKSSFIGINTGSTPIALLLLGNDSAFLGHTLDPSGGLAFYDNAVWAAIPEPGALTLAMVSTIGAAFYRSKH